jgi:hypothetical protein
MPHSILSVRQPWAGLLVSGVKRFEVRSWAPALAPGWVLIHASSGRAVGLGELYEYRAFNKALRLAGMEDQGGWVQRAVIGAVKFAAFLDTWKVEQQPKHLSEIDRMMIGEAPDRFLWKVVEAKTFRKPIQCHGKLNLWKPTDALSRKLDQAIKRDMRTYRQLS